MSIGESLSSKLKKQKNIKTNIGNFSYKKSLGEGGNSFVFLFSCDDKDFAIKFLKPSDDKKFARFRDEFFCVAQMSTHKNIAQSYHFDAVDVDKDVYFIIIMKFYEKTLKSLGHVSGDEDVVKMEKGVKLFYDILNALGFLHENNVIHRDVKPENIFFDVKNNNYVLGDMGIAHFSEEFPKLSETKPTDRMANYKFSAPEQVDSKSPPRAANDIYSLGQVLQWFLTNTTVRGLDRQTVSGHDSPEKLKVLDKIIDKCLKNDPSKRFQSKAEIINFIKEMEKPQKHDYWKPLHELDDVIRKSFPKIKDVISTTEKTQIERFLGNFHSQCRSSDFWYMNMDGGDGEYVETRRLDGDKWLFWNLIEITIEKLFVYLDNGHPYKNFFVLLLFAEIPFEITDVSGVKLERTLLDDWKEDSATYFDGRYIDTGETVNGYYEFGNEVVPVNREYFHERIRHLEKYAYIVVPQGTATACMIDRTPTERFLKSIVESGNIMSENLKAYLDATRKHHRPEITMYN